jgi:hypothetical protein
MGTLTGHECDAGRETKDPACVQTKEGWFTSVFKAAAWRLHLLYYAHLVVAAAIRVGLYTRMLHRMVTNGCRVHCFVIWTRCGLFTLIIRFRNDYEVCKRF